ncbi:MAG: DUF6298 domain-containing protein [Acidobacteriaceae bacterium]|jgi:hypothetical protein
MSSTKTATALIALALSGGFAALAQAPQSPVPIDFSVAGYEAGKPLPVVNAVISVRPTGKDDTVLLQNAIDHVAALPPQPDGFRGAILLRPGIYHVSGHLRIRAGGIVLRGSGPSTTTIVANGISRRTLIEAGGEADPSVGPPHSITDDAPVGAKSFKLAGTAGFSVGQQVLIRRPSTAAWIKSLGMTGLPGTFANARLDWAPGSHDLLWDRTITAVDPATNQIEVDAPITTALEKQYGGGTVAIIQSNPVLEKIGIEELTLSSAYDAKYPKDEDHSWIAIELDRVQDAWVRNITARHFADSAVFVGHRARRVTVIDSRSEAPVSEPGGYRRQSFVVYGQQTLIYRCHSDSGMNDFATGLVASGPNVFLDDEAANSLEPSGPFEGWASGVLYENVRVPASKIQMVLDQTRAQGAGWTAANSLIWNSTAQALEAKGPDQAPNFVVNNAKPLFESQLAARNLQLAALDAKPAFEDKNLPGFTDAVTHNVPPAPAIHPITVVNGRFVEDGKVLWGENQGEAWWKGSTSPFVAAQLTQSSITRFMPGQTAPGLTEDLNEFAARMKQRNAVFIQVNPGLWYDHRRDAHFIAPEPDGNVWAPFFELPWARSGQGVGYDGLSKWDVSRYNPWYFERHREFAKLAAEQGFVVYFDLYNDHNVLEIGPHYADFPWRTANSINNTGMPEPPPYHPGGTKLDVGNEFFNVENAPLRKLHHDYIIHVLDELGDQPNVIFGAAYQFAGPLAFEQFFQDTIAEWEKAHHRTVRIALTTGKNTTDAILADPVRSKQIAVVDMRYWTYMPDGTLWAPPAGINQAFRAQIEAKFPGYQDTPPGTTPELVYKQVREYRDRYPNIAFVPMESGAGPLPILMAGGAAQSSLRGGGSPGARIGGPNQDPIIDKFVHDYLADDLMKMNPVDGWAADPAANWVLADDKADVVLIDARSGPTLTLAKALAHPSYRAIWFDPNTGTAKDPVDLSIKAGTAIPKPGEKDWLLLLRATR